MVTVVLTSCNRHDLLKITLESLIAYAGDQIKSIIIVEDGPMLPGEWLRTIKRELFSDIIWINTGERIGQIKAIDLAYSKVETKFIFHCEDDWAFYKSGFIEESMKILNEFPDIITVWLRGFHDTNGHPFHYNAVRKIYVMNLNYVNGRWHGFTFNPGLRRLKDYKLIAPFSQHTEFKINDPSASEARIGQVYKNMGFMAAILPGRYVKHIGEGRHVQ